MRNIITAEEQKEIMLDMLRHIDELSRKNHIWYSLIGGSLIGAIRHRGYIPWDDDVDIILTKENYDKLCEVLKKHSGRYKVLDDRNGGKHFSFIKLVDTATRLLEFNYNDFGSNYGIFIDIFCYYPTATNYTKRYKHYERIELLRALISRRRLDFKNYSLRQNIRWACKNSISKIIGYRMINKLFDKCLNKYSGENTDYVVSNWPAYGFEKEIQLKKNTEEYIDVKFEDLTVMIFKNYDEILKTTFGDYMQLPPESERIPKHNMKMWWREGYEDEAEKLKARMKKKDRNEQAKK